MKLYDFELSGNCYKARLLLQLLQLPYQGIAMDLRGGAHKKPDFLALNPKGQVPVLEDGEHVIADSQAILVYLAEKETAREWYPADPVSRAQIQFWLSTASNEVTHGPARARYYTKFGIEGDVAAAQALAERLFAWLAPVMEKRNWLVGSRPTIADIAMFPYIALAHEGRLSLEPYPAIRAWIERIKGIDRFIGMPGL